MQSLWENTSPSFKAAFSQTLDIRRNVSQKFIEPSMEPPYWCTYLRGTPIWRSENNVFLLQFVGK